MCLGLGSAAEVTLQTLLVPLHLITHHQLLRWHAWDNLASGAALQAPVRFWLNAAIHGQC